MFDSREIVSKALLRAEVIREEKRKRVRRMTVGLSCSCMVLALAGVALFLYDGDMDGYTHLSDDDVPLGVIVHENKTEQNEIAIPAKAAEAKIISENPEFSGYCFTFEVQLNENGDTIFSSDLLNRGEQKDSIVLAEPLEKGTYKAHMFVRVFDPDDKDLEVHAELVAFEIVIE